MIDEISNSSGPIIHSHIIDVVLDINRIFECTIKAIEFAFFFRWFPFQLFGEQQLSTAIILRITQMHWHSCDGIDKCVTLDLNSNRLIRMLKFTWSRNFLCHIYWGPTVFCAEKCLCQLQATGDLNMFTVKRIITMSSISMDNNKSIEDKAQ